MHYVRQTESTSVRGFLLRLFPMGCAKYSWKLDTSVGLLSREMPLVYIHSVRDYYQCLSNENRLLLYKSSQLNAKWGTLLQSHARSCVLCVLVRKLGFKSQAKVNAALGSGTGIFLMKCILVDNSVYTGTTEEGRSIKGRIWQVYCSST